ncbi:MAG: carboxypeptidase regulatory-like domain-containing protein [Planctomycetes bacterium]|nr:carboxypeptidase regulatory-like domain-containing protein [Planctomycetota bacterium]
MTHFRTALIVFALTVSPAMANILNGTVTSGGSGLAGVTVEVFGSTVTATTAANGTFSLNLPAGTYHLQIVPPAGLGLAPTILDNVALAAATLTLPPIALSTGSAVSGTVVTGAGLAVVGGDIDVFDLLTGFKLVSENDTTSATGGFVVQVPNRSLRVRAEPMAGQVLVAKAQIVNVVANINLGNIVLPAGVLLSGTVRSSANNAALAGVDIDVDDAAGLRVETPSDNTTATGTFSVVVPTGTFVVTFQPAPGQLFAARRLLNVVVTAATNVGTVLLDPGVALAGLVLRNGQPVANADIDVRAQAGDTIQLTLSDSTDATGHYSVVVRPGIYRVVVEPAKSTLFLAQSTGFVNFATSATIPTFNLLTGQLLSGTVLAPSGVQPEGNCTIVVSQAMNGQIIETADNRSAANGNYSVVVPTGTFNVEFQTRKGSLSRDQVQGGVTVSGPTTLNVTLAPLTMFVFLIDPADPDPQIVPAGNPLLITVVIYNPTGFTSGALLDVEVVSPLGAVTTLVTGSPVVLGAGGYILGQFFPIPLPALNPAQVNQPHLFRLRLRDAGNGGEIDADEMIFLPQ